MPACGIATMTGREIRMANDAPSNRAPSNRQVPIKDLLGGGGVSLTRSESRIVQLLLADYPVAGLGSASSLAKRAGVSDPTVARFVTKFGFETFAAFQATLLEEVEARLRRSETRRVGKACVSPCKPR